MDRSILEQWRRTCSGFGADGTRNCNKNVGLCFSYYYNFVLFQLPGVNVPFSDIGYYVVTLGICSIVHEFGHALAASREDVQLFGVGILIAYILPVAYVSMSNEQLASLPVINQLRVLCAGIWHNIVLAAFSALILVMSAWFWAPLFTFGAGVTVKSIAPVSMQFIDFETFLHVLQKDKIFTEFPVVGTHRTACSGHDLSSERLLDSERRQLVSLHTGGC